MRNRIGVSPRDIYPIFDNMGYSLMGLDKRHLTDNGFTRGSALLIFSQRYLNVKFLLMKLESEIPKCVNTTVPLPT